MPLTVVVVDDDAGFRRVVRSLLQRLGLVVVAEAGNGRAAIDAVRDYRPDGVLLDVGLPDRDGLSVTRAVASRPGAATRWSRRRDRPIADRLPAAPGWTHRAGQHLPFARVDRKPR